MTDDRDETAGGPPDSSILPMTATDLKFEVDGRALINCGSFTLDGGARTVVLPGVEIGPRTIVASNSVVTRTLPPDSVCAGNPARPFGSLDQYLEQHRRQIGASGLEPSADANAIVAIAPNGLLGRGGGGTEQCNQAETNHRLANCGINSDQESPRGISRAL